MRAYFFGNMYLSSIQQGIQAAHVVADMFIDHNLKYGGEQADMLEDWASNHKTMILLNAGYGANIHDLCEFFSAGDNPYPWSYFKESEPALDGALTSVGIVLPEKIYEGAAAIRCDAFVVDQLKATDTITLEASVESYTKWEQELMQRLNTFRLAN